MQFKLGYSTLRWQEPDLEPALETLKKAGWDGWEARMPADWLGPPSRLRRVCENVGLPMAVYTASGSPDVRDWAHVERNHRRMEYAAEVGADCFMFMSGVKPAGRSVTEDDLTAAAEGAEAWAEYAESLGLEISYHIHTNTLVDSVADWKFYSERLRKARLCIDVSHAKLWGYDPSDSIRDFRSRLNYMHLQDYASTSRDESGRYDPVWCDVGEGPDVDFVAIRRALVEIGFSRWVTSCPGIPIPGADDPISEARRSRKTYAFLRRIGY